MSIKTHLNCGRPNGEFTSASQQSKLPAAQQNGNKATVLKSCISKNTLQAVFRSGLCAEHMANPEEIITMLRTRCNTGRNNDVWFQQFQSRCKRQDDSVEDWLCDLRDLAQKADFATGYCANCEPERLLGQVIFGVSQKKRFRPTTR